MSVRSAIAVFVIIFAFPIMAQAEDAKPKVGMVMMYGKALAGHDPVRTMSIFLGNMRGKGYVLDSPEMPWSPRHHYDVSFAEMLGQIDAAIGRLKEQGATVIFLGGHSFGAAAALAYCRAHPEAIRGVVSLSAGHMPEAKRMRELFADDVAKARQMVADGRGSETAPFDEMNQGEPMAVWTTAGHYVDWFAPDGPMNLHDNVAHCANPVFWAISTDEQGKPVDRPMFTLLPPNPMNRFVVIPGTHVDTADGAASDVVQWIEALR